MIFYIYFVLIMAGFYAVSTLFGSYMIRYGGAREIDLGFLFMILPITIFARPLICAQADRHQSHKQMLAFFSILSSLSYIPFAVMPFIVSDTNDPHDENQRIRYWLMVLFHASGSIGFCGMRSLGDATTVNFAKRFGTNYTRYRKYGSLSYGIFGYLVGRINQHWLLPDFVPAFIVYCSCTLTLGLLTYAWPDEYFRMTTSEGVTTSKVGNKNQQQIEFGSDCKPAELPSPMETFTHVCRRLFCLGGASSTNSKSATVMIELNAVHLEKVQGTHLDTKAESQAKNLTIRQQLSIFKLLAKRDFRLVLYLFIIFWNGLCAYSGANFVFTYLNETCQNKGTCNGAELAGTVMISYCAVETISYIIIDKLRGNLNRILMIEITFISVIIHYYFYGFLLDSLSPYWFLIESLHGIEYSIGLSSSIELGYYFAREVELLIPELISNGIISEQDDKDRVKVSLMATMSGTFSFMYDGVGCILGCLVYGLTTGLYSYRTTWILIGSLSSVGFLMLLCAWFIGKCFHIKPQILNLRDK